MSNSFWAVPMAALFAVAMSAQGAALAGLGRYAEAEPLLTRSEAILSKDGGAPPVFRTLNERYLDALHQRERPANQVKLTSSPVPDASAQPDAIPQADQASAVR